MPTSETEVKLRTLHCSRHKYGTIIPLQVGVLRAPPLTARRCHKLGKSLRKAILSYPEDLKVAIVATVGLSHQVQGERDAWPWAVEFRERLEKDPESLTNITAAEYSRLGGWEGAEVIMWLIIAWGHGVQGSEVVLPAFHHGDRYCDL